MKEGMRKEKTPETLERIKFNCTSSFGGPIIKYHDKSNIFIPMLKST